jgi:hypothetical protein
LLGEVTAQDFDEGATRYVLHVPYSAPHAELAALDAWYVGEHDAMVMRCAEWTAIRRYEPVEGSTADWSRLVVHELLGAEVLNSPYVRESMATPQRRRFAEHDWFGAGGRHVLPIVVPSQAKQGSRASTTSR